MTETLQQIKAAVMNGLTRPEIEGLLGRKLEGDEVQEFNKTRALLKLKERQEEIDKTSSRLQPPAAGITNALQPKLPPVKDRYTKEQLEECIDRHLGVVTSICNDLDCTYSQFYKAVKHYGIEGKIAEARKAIVAEAEGALMEALRSRDERLRFDAAKYTLSRLGKDAGWGDVPMAVAVEVSKDEKAQAIRAIFGMQGASNE